MKRTLVLAFLGLLAFAGTSKADVIITEFLADPLDVADSVGEYFELYNSGATAIDVGDLTIGDDGSDSLDLSSFAGTFLNPGEFLVFGNEPSTTADWVDVDYSSVGSLFLSNGADEIVITETSSGTELARLVYTDGDAPGDGIALVLNNTANAVGGVTQESDYIAEIAANDTLSTADIGSPGVAGSTVISVIPEPASAALIGCFGAIAFMRRRRS
ncbi:MAG: lamin tail domain-containing protein [Planctomycetota bacterium]